MILTLGRCPWRELVGPLIRSLSQFAVREIEFTACQNLFLTPTGVETRNLPAKGFRFNTKYIDTSPRASLWTPTVLILHGLPGSHKDFSAVIENLDSRGVRVIVPNFPGFGWTPMDRRRNFKHTTKEKTSFVLEFLSALKIDRVDLMVTHSGASFLAVNLCSIVPSLASGLVLINPGVHKRYKSLSFVFWKYMELHTKLMQERTLRPLAISLLWLYLKMINYPNQDAEAMSIAIETFAQVDFEEYVRQIMALSRRSFPTSIMYARNDRLIEAESSLHLSRLLGCSEANLMMYDSLGNPIQSLPNAATNYADGHIFETGGHFVMLKHPHATSDIIFNLLGRVRKNRDF